MTSRVDPVGECCGDRGVPGQDRVVVTPWSSRLLAPVGAVLAVAVVAVWSIWPVSKLGAGLLLPVIAWVSLASVALVALITGQPF